MTSTSRRRFMTIGAAAGGGLLFGFSLYGCNKDGDRKAPPSEKAVGAAATGATNRAPGLAQDAFIRIDRAGIVTMIVHKVEMGQGTWTSMPMLLAEELGVDLAKVKLEQAPANNNLYSDPMLHVALCPCTVLSLTPFIWMTASYVLCIHG